MKEFARFTIQHMIARQYHGRRRTSNINDLESSWKSCLNFLLSSQKICPNETDFCQTEGGVAPSPRLMGSTKESERWKEKANIKKPC